MITQSKLLEFRARYMSTRKVICTGNPLNPWTVAHSVQKLFPDATFIHRSNGWDLTDQSAEAVTRLSAEFARHNTFINASYIAPYVQSNLLKICNQSVKFCDVFNLGSTYEYECSPDKQQIQESKLNLRNLSLKLNTFRFKTHHIILGSLITGPEQTGIEIDKVCELITWILDQEFEVPLMAMTQPKEPW